MATSNAARLFANKKCITAWRAEAKRVAQLSTSSTHVNHVANALALLDELYCLHNPQHKSPLQMRQAIFASFLEASLAGFPLAMFFEGLARKEGFGCQIDVVTGHALIQVASARKCPEAMNYLALCYYRQNVVVALNLLSEASRLGHVQAGSNLQVLVEYLRNELRRRRSLDNRSVRPSPLRMQA